MVDAEKIASKQKQISISEFFEKNKHFLGFDTLQRSLITAVKEAVDNSLDACEEARILPEINVEIRKLKGDRIELKCEDNGPGIPKDAVPNVFGRFLLGSRFHAIRQTRGQQGIGITGVVMYSQLTTGSKTKVTSITEREEHGLASVTEIALDTRRNKAIPTTLDRAVLENYEGERVKHGLKIETTMKAKYQRGKQSVFQYLRMTSIVNPHATIRLIVRDDEGIIDKGHWISTTKKLPKTVEEIKPHPLSATLAQLQRMLKETDEKKLSGFLQHEFSPMPLRAVKEIAELSGVELGRVPSRIKTDDAASILAAFSEVKYTDPKNFEVCLSPIEDLLIKKGLSKAIDSRFASTVSRNPILIQGVPYQVEVGLVFGGDLPSDGPIEVLRFANRVPLMYQQGGCLLTKGLESVDWKNYGLDHPGAKGLPKGPAAVLIHLASTNVQFTSEAKEAVADNDALMKEIRKSMQEVGRGLKAHLKTRKDRKKAREKFDLINIILPEISRKSSQMLGRDEPPLAPVITKIMNAVFIEDEIIWENERKENICTITMYNYTNRARKYNVFAKWPEREGVEIVGDNLRSTRETNGLRKWVLEALDPGEKVEIVFVVRGLEKGDWNETDIFFKGTGERDIIGANRIDEKLLNEMKDIEKTKKKTEKLELAKKEHKSNISENTDSGFSRIHDRSLTGDEELGPDVRTTERETQEKIHQDITRIDHWSEE